MDPDEAAVLARTSLDRARSAALLTYPDGLSAGPHLTNVAVSACDDGSAVVLLRPDSPAARHLVTRPFAVVQIAPQGCKRVSLHGATQRLPSRDATGRAAYRVEAAAVRLGNQGEFGVETDAYASARPHPVVSDAPAVVAHDRRQHTAAPDGHDRHIGLL